MIEIDKWFKEQGGGWFFTDTEGGIWGKISFDGNPNVDEIEKDLRGTPLDPDDTSITHFRHIHFQSLRFPDGRIWDSYFNGFRP